MSLRGLWHRRRISGSVHVTVDAREPRAAALALEDRGVTVAVRNLHAGDYVVGSGTLVERKTVRGLHLDVVSGRFWAQLNALRAACVSPWLVVEGADLADGPASDAAVRGVLVAATDLGVGVLRSDNLEETATWLHLLARRRQLPLPRRRPRRVPPVVPTSSGEAMLAAVPGVAQATARRLLLRFGSVAAIAAAPIEELIGIPGIGAKRAEAIHDALTDPAASPAQGEPSPAAP